MSKALQIKIEELFAATKGLMSLEEIKPHCDQFNEWLEGQNYSAKFTSVEGKPNHVVFAGQGKKRGKTPVFEIPTLYPADYIIKALSHLRNEPSTKALLKEVLAEFPRDIPAQNRTIDSKRNGSLNRVVREYFGDKGQSNPVLKFRHGEDQDNCTALRAAYAALVTERDCKGSIGTKMLYASQVLGHFIRGEKPSDEELRAFVRTALFVRSHKQRSLSLTLGLFLR